MRRRAVGLLYDLEDILAADDLAVRHWVHRLDLSRRTSVLVVTVQAPLLAEIVIRLICELERMRRPAGKARRRAAALGALPHRLLVVAGVGRVALHAVVTTDFDN